MAILFPSCGVNYYFVAEVFAVIFFVIICATCARFLEASVCFADFYMYLFAFVFAAVIARIYSRHTSGILSHKRIFPPKIRGGCNLGMFIVQ